MPVIRSRTHLHRSVADQDSRRDLHFGDNIHFDPKTYQQTSSYWTSDVVTLQMLAYGRTVRRLDPKAFNPTYLFGVIQDAGSLGENAMLVLVS